MSGRCLSWSCLCFGGSRRRSRRGLHAGAATAPCAAAGVPSIAPEEGGGTGGPTRGVAAFREIGKEVLARAPADAALWAAACDLLDALLEGVDRQLPTVEVAVELTPHGDPGAAGGPALPSMTVNFSLAPLTGEFATRTRVACYIHLEDELVFMPRFETLPQGRALTLQVQGLSSRPFDDAAHMRSCLKQELDGKLSPATALEWWTRRKDEVCPLESSKTRWVVESLLGAPALSRVIPTRGKENLIWGLAHARCTRIEGFTFCFEGKHGLRLSATRAAAGDDTERHLDACVFEAAAPSLERERSMAEVMAPAAINWTAMLFAHHVGQAGAQPRQIVKLMSGASRWSAGSSGWQRFDQTWVCEDKKDALGRVTEEQGRLVWRLPSAAATLAWPEALGSCDQEPEPFCVRFFRSYFCCAARPPSIR